MQRFFACALFLLTSFFAYGQTCVDPAADMVIPCGTTFCEGDTICVQNNSPEDDPNVFYRWFWGPDGGDLCMSDVIFEKTDTFFVFNNECAEDNTSSCFEIQLFAFRDCGDGTILTGNNITLITIIPPPEANIEMEDIEACLPNTTITFTNGSDVGGTSCGALPPNIEYIWYFGDGNISNEESAVLG